MSYCTNCGSYIPESETVCPACGVSARPQGGAAQATQSAPSGSYTDTSKDPWENKKDVKEPWETRPTPRYPAADNGSARQSRQAAPGSQSAGGDATQDQRLSVLSYVGPLFLLPLLLRRGDPFARFHANQGLILFIVECLIGMFFGDGLLAVAGALFCLYCLVIGAKNVAAGKMERLPFIGKLDLLK